MRKIIEDAVSAFMNHENFRRTNTEVYEWGGHICTLYLFWNEIAKHNQETGEIYISTAWWNTNTKKERIRGILNHIWWTLTSKKWQLYLNNEAWDGKWILIGNF